MKIFEITNHTANFLGTCVNSFDEDGDCVVPQLGYRNVIDFAQHEENAIEISKEEFIKKVGNIDPDLRSVIGSDLVFLHAPAAQETREDIYMVYDTDSDIHYFFSPSNGLTEGSQNSVEIHSGISHAYHVTPVENLSSILQNGLRPSVGPRSSKIKDEQSGIYLFPDLNSVSDAISNWLGDEFDDETELALLKINIRGLEKHISSSVGYELVINKPISPNRISVSSELDLTESASGYIPSNKEKNDPRYKMGLTVDIKPDSIQKNAKALGSKISRAGIPPQARTNGKI